MAQKYSDKDHAAGDDMAQRDEDRDGWKISADMVTGGEVRDLEEEGTCEVGYGPEVDQAGANKG